MFDVVYPYINDIREMLDQDNLEDNVHCDSARGEPRAGAFSLPCEANTDDGDSVTLDGMAFFHGGVCCDCALFCTVGTEKCGGPARLCLRYFDSALCIVQLVQWRAIGANRSKVSLRVVQEQHCIQPRD
jgi:hypothetical protein